MDGCSGEEIEQWAGSLTTIFCKRYNMRREDFEDLDSEATVYLLETLQKVNNGSTEKSFVYKSVLGLMLNFVDKEIKKNQHESLSDVEYGSDCVSFDWDDMPAEHRIVHGVVFDIYERLPSGRDSPCKVRKEARSVLRSEYGWSHRRVRRVFNELKEIYGS